MDKFWWRAAAWGFCLVHLSLAQIELNVTCRYAGVFHVEKNGRYSISRTEAADLCTAFNSTLPTMAQMERALEVGFETCRYGFIQGHVVIPRIHPNSICAANNTGVYVLTSNTSQYDTYCFNASAPLDGEDCASITNLTNAFEGQVSITIVNRDGTRYVQKGEYRTNPNDINPSSAPEEDISSGSASERSTSGGFIILSTTHPTEDKDRPWVSHDPANTPTMTSAQDNYPHERMTTQNPEDSSWTDFIDPFSHPMGQGHQTENSLDMDSSHSTTLQPSADPNVDSVEDTTQQNPAQSFSTSHSGMEEDEDYLMTSAPTSSTSNEGKDRQEGENHPQDSTTSLEGYTPHSSDTGEQGTIVPVSPAGTVAPEVTIVGEVSTNVDGSLSGDHDDLSFDYDSRGKSHTTHGSESAGHASGNQAGGVNPTSGPKRKPQIPEWLIILASLLALALILAVCIAVNSRRRCGQKKKLVINNGNGAVEDRKPSGLNGEASKSQEMVHLVNKETSGTPDQFMTADETRNLQNVDMKIGV